MQDLATLMDSLTTADAEEEMEDISQYFTIHELRLGIMFNEMLDRRGWSRTPTAG